jgi:tetratricopeptide (TPR) repeat protein
MADASASGAPPEEATAPPDPSPAPAARLSPGAARLAIAAALAVGAFLLYLQVAHHAFLFYDDGQYVAENGRVRAGLTWSNVKWAFTTLYFSNWHPLTWLSHMLDVELFGLDAGAHHLVNAALHALNGAVLFLVLDRMTGARGRSAFVAALFAVHPIHVESVAWVAERKDLLSTLLALLALAAWQRFARLGGWRRYALVAVAFAASLLAKPMWVTFPFVLLLLDVWPLRRARGFAEGAGVPLGRLCLEKAPLLALSLASSIVTVVAQDRGGAVVGLEVGLAERAANAVVSYARYLGKTLWPADLAVFYPQRPLPAWQIAAATLLVAGVTAALLARAKRWPWAAVGWLWFLGTLVPVIGLVQVGAQAMADRYTYAPSIGLFVIASWGAHALARDRAARLVPAAAGLAVAILAVVAWRQTGRWVDHETLFRHAIAVTEENPRAHGGLAMGLRRAGKLEEARLHAAEAVRLEPDGSRHWLNLALIERDLGRPAEAREAIERAIALNPGLGLASTLRGQIEGDLGRAEDAEQALRRATALAPDDARAWNELGSALVRSGRTAEALDAWGRAVALDPGFASAWSNLAILQQGLGNVPAAGEAFGAAARAEPANPLVWRNLGIFEMKAARPAEAANAFVRAVRLDPTNPDLLFRLGTAQLALGALGDALATAARLEPLSPAAAAALRAQAGGAP